MGTQYETVTVTVGGANPQSITVTVPVNTSTGAGSATFNYTGTHSGTDTLQAAATIAGTPYSSNSAQVAWQSTNGNIQVGNIVTCYAWGDSPTSGPVASYLWGSTGSGIPRTITSFGVQSLTGNSFSFDYYNTSGGLASGVGDGSDPVWATYNSAGNFVSYQSWPPYLANFNCITLGYILVPAPGSYTMTLTYKDGSMWGIVPNINTGANPTWAGQGSYTGNAGQTVTANSSYPLLYAPPMSSGEGGYVNTAGTIVNYPSAGVYPIEVNWDYWYHSGRILHVTANSADLAPVDLISAPPSSTPTGNLTITPAGGATNLQVTGQPITLTVNVSGIVYSTISYCPVFEGQTGYLNIYNNNSDSFTFQTYNGQSVNASAAVSAGVFSLSSSDNTAYQGLFSVGLSGSTFVLNYNGGSANPNSTSRVLSTNLIVTADDIAWYDSTNNSFDLFSVSGVSGGIVYSFEINYMVLPAVASISPTTIQANSESNTLAITLTKALSPQQQGAFNTGNTIVPSCSITGAQSTGTPVAVLDSNGWLTGWNVPFTAPTATSNQTLTVGLIVTGTLTYLSGNTFVTNPAVTYINNPNIGTITATGVNFQPPVAYGFSSPSAWSSTTMVTLTAQIFTPGTNDPVSVDFVANITEDVDIPSGQHYTYNYTNNIGVGSLVSSSVAIVGGVSGYLQTYTLTTQGQDIIPESTNQSGTTVDYSATIGFIGTDTVSDLSCSYTSTTTYETT